MSGKASTTGFAIPDIFHETGPATAYQVAPDLCETGATEQEAIWRCKMKRMRACACADPFLKWRYPPSLFRTKLVQVFKQFTGGRGKIRRLRADKSEFIRQSGPAALGKSCKQALFWGKATRWERPHRTTKTRTS